MKKRNLFICSFFITLLFTCFSSVQAQAKSHFRILENGIEVQNSPYHAAAAEINMDLFRYTDGRRQVPISGTNYVIELFSGQELFSTYQKQISPNNHPIAQDIYPNLEFIPSGNRIKISY